MNIRWTVSGIAINWRLAALAASAYVLIGCAAPYRDILLRHDAASAVRSVGYVVHVPGDTVTANIVDDATYVVGMAAACCLGAAAGPGFVAPVPSGTAGSPEKAKALNAVLAPSGWSGRSCLSRVVDSLVAKTESSYTWADYRETIPGRIVQALAQGGKATRTGSAAAVYVRDSGLAHRVDALALFILLQQGVERPAFGTVSTSAQLRGVLVSTADISRVLWRRTVTVSHPLKAQYKECLASDALLVRRGLETAIASAVEALRASLRAE
jgi:hypothetical protein